MNRFIVANDTNTYEWDSANDTLPLKYNSALFGCTALFTNISKDSFILVHQYNGISIFGGTPIIMQKQYCFYEAGYQIGDACFDPLHEILALSFVRSDHEKVVILNVKTGMQKDVFSAFDTGESFANMCFSDNGNFLLVISQYRCVECNLENIAQIIISSAGDNERFISRNYVGKEVEIAVVEHSAISEPKVHSYCIYYKKVGKIEEISYKRS